MLENDVELTADDGVAVDNDVVVGAAALGSGHMPPEARSRSRETGVLRSERAPRGLAFSRRAACDGQPGWFSDVSDGAVLRLRFLLRVGFVERQETILCAGALVWSFSPASDADELSLIP